jgi:hypothetical protein
MFKLNSKGIVKLTVKTDKYIVDGNEVKVKSCFTIKEIDNIEWNSDLIGSVSICADRYQKNGFDINGIKLSFKPVKDSEFLFDLIVDNTKDTKYILETVKVSKYHTTNNLYINCDKNGNKIDTTKPHAVLGINPIVCEGG